MKNERTPRQMRDGQWSYGSVSVERDTQHALGDLLIAVIAVVVLALIAIGGTI
jgi:hypothetical protein